MYIYIYIYIYIYYTYNSCGLKKPKTLTTLWKLPRKIAACRKTAAGSLPCSSCQSLPTRRGESRDQVIYQVSIHKRLEDIFLCESTPPIISNHPQPPTGWWFGCHQFLAFSQIMLGCDYHPNRRTPSFFRGVALAHQPAKVFRLR